MRVQRFAGLALAAFAWCGAAGAQEISATALVPYAVRPEAVQCVVATARPHEGVRGDLTLKVQAAWPYGEVRVRQSVNLRAGSTRSFVIPAPLNPYDSATVSLDDLNAFTSVSLGGGSSSVSPTFFAVLGLGGRVTAAIQAVASDENLTQARLIAGTMQNDPTSGDPLVPPFAAAFGGTHSVIAGSGAILAAPPEARRALRQWVMAGGFLAIAPRTVADLRDPWFVDLLGPVTDDGGGHLSGPRLLARRWGAAVHVGLGVAGVIPHDLSAEGWAREAGADAALRDFVDFADGAGGGIVAPGELSLFRRFSRAGLDDVSRAFRPVADVRGLLIPVTVLLTLYVIGVGVTLARNRKGRAPLKVFVRLPLVALTVLAVIVAAARTTRTSASTARVLAVYDVGEGAGQAVERVFAGLNAGVASTLALTPPGEGVALYSTGGNSMSAAMRWDGQRLAVERVRLGLWETGLAYTERMVDAGGGVHYSRERSTVRVTNNSPWEFTSLVLVSEGVVMARFGAAGRGATVEATLRAATQSTSFDAMFPGASENLGRVFVDRMMGATFHARGAVQLFGLARMPDSVRAWVRGVGFAPNEEAALVRVVIPQEAQDPERVGAYSARLGVRRNDYEPEEVPSVQPQSVSEDASVTDDAGEAGAP